MKLINGRLGQYYWHRYCRLLIPSDPFLRIGKEIFLHEAELRRSESGILTAERIGLEKNFFECAANKSGGFDLWSDAASFYASNPVFRAAEPARILDRKHAQKNHPWLKLRRIGRQEVFTDYPSPLKFENRRRYQFYGGFPLLYRDRYWVNRYLSQYDIRFYRRRFFWWAERQAERQLGARRSFFQVARLFLWPAKKERVLGQRLEPLGAYGSSGRIFSRTYSYRFTIRQAPEVFFVDPTRFDWQKNRYFQMYNLFVLCRARPLLLPFFTRANVNFAWCAAQDPLDQFRRVRVAAVALAMDSSYLRRWDRHRGFNFVTNITDELAYSQRRVAEVFDNYCGVRLLIWLGRTAKSLHTDLLKTTILRSDGVFRVGLPIEELDFYSGGEYYFHLYEMEENQILSRYGRLLASYLTNRRYRATYVLGEEGSEVSFFEFLSERIDVRCGEFSRVTRVLKHWVYLNLMEGALDEEFREDWWRTARFLKLASVFYISPFPLEQIGSQFRKLGLADGFVFLAAQCGFGIKVFFKSVFYSRFSVFSRFRRFVAVGLGRVEFRRWWGVHFSRLRLLERDALCCASVAQSVEVGFRRDKVRWARRNEEDVRWRSFEFGLVPGLFRRLKKWDQVAALKKGRRVSMQLFFFDLFRSLAGTAAVSVVFSSAAVRCFAGELTRSWNLAMRRFFDFFARERTEEEREERFRGTALEALIPDVHFRHRLVVRPSKGVARRVLRRERVVSRVLRKMGRVGIRRRKDCRSVWWQFSRGWLPSARRFFMFMGGRRKVVARIVDVGSSAPWSEVLRKLFFLGADRRVGVRRYSPARLVGEFNAVDPFLGRRRRRRRRLYPFLSRRALIRNTVHSVSSYARATRYNVWQSQFDQLYKLSATLPGGAFYNRNYLLRIGWQWRLSGVGRLPYRPLVRYAQNSPLRDVDPSRFYLRDNSWIQHRRDMFSFDLLTFIRGWYKRLGLSFFGALGFKIPTRARPFFGRSKVANLGAVGIVGDAYSLPRHNGFSKFLARPGFEKMHMFSVTALQQTETRLGGFMGLVRIMGAWGGVEEDLNAVDEWVFLRHVAHELNEIGVVPWDKNRSRRLYLRVLAKRLRVMRWLETTCDKLEFEVAGRIRSLRKSFTGSASELKRFLVDIERYSTFSGQDRGVEDNSGQLVQNVFFNRVLSRVSEFSEFVHELLEQAGSESEVAEVPKLSWPTSFDSIFDERCFWTAQYLVFSIVGGEGVSKEFLLCVFFFILARRVELFALKNNVFLSSAVDDNSPVLKVFYDYLVMSQFGGFLFPEFADLSIWSAGASRVRELDISASLPYAFFYSTRWRTLGGGNAGRRRFSRRRMFLRSLMVDAPETRSDLVAHKEWAFLRTWASVIHYRFFVRERAEKILLTNPSFKSKSLVRRTGVLDCICRRVLVTAVTGRYRSVEQFIRRRARTFFLKEKDFRAPIRIQRQIDTFLVQLFAFVYYKWFRRLFLLFKPLFFTVRGARVVRGGGERRRLRRLVRNLGWVSRLPVKRSKEQRLAANAYLRGAAKKKYWWFSASGLTSYVYNWMEAVLRFRKFPLSAAGRKKKNSGVRKIVVLIYKLLLCRGRSRTVVQQRRLLEMLKLENAQFIAARVSSARRRWYLAYYRRKTVKWLPKRVWKQLQRTPLRKKRIAVCRAQKPQKVVVQAIHKLPLTGRGLSLGTTWVGPISAEMWQPRRFSRSGNKRRFDRVRRPGFRFLTQPYRIFGRLYRIVLCRSAKVDQIALFKRWWARFEGYTSVVSSPSADKLFARAGRFVADRPVQPDVFPISRPVRLDKRGRELKLFKFAVPPQPRRRGLFVVRGFRLAPNLRRNGLLRTLESLERLPAMRRFKEEGRMRWRNNLPVSPHWVIFPTGNPGRRKFLRRAVYLKSNRGFLPRKEWLFARTDGRRLVSGTAVAARWRYLTKFLLLHRSFLSILATADKVKRRAADKVKRRRRSGILWQMFSGSRRAKKAQVVAFSKLFRQLAVLWPQIIRSVGPVLNVYDTPLSYLRVAYHGWFRVFFFKQVYRRGKPRYRDGKPLLRRSSYTKAGYGLVPFDRTEYPRSNVIRVAAVYGFNRVWRQLWR